MKFNTPLPQPLPKECLKAAQICTLCFEWHRLLLSDLLSTYLSQVLR